MPEVVLGVIDILNLELIFEFKNDLMAANIKETQFGEIRLTERFAFLEIAGTPDDIPMTVLEKYNPDISLSRSYTTHGHHRLVYLINGVERRLRESYQEMEAEG